MIYKLWSTYNQLIESNCTILILSLNLIKPMIYVTIFFNYIEFLVIMKFYNMRVYLKIAASWNYGSVLL